MQADTNTIGEGSTGLTAADVQRARNETPGCEHVIHFNNAGAGLMPQPVLDATTGYLQIEARIGGYEAAASESDRVERIYQASADLINANPDEIAVIENATRAWDMAFYSIPLGPGDRILTVKAEYASNYIAYLQVARKIGATVEAIPNDENGQVSVDALRDMIDEDVKLISVTHMPTSGGLVNPVEEIGAVARDAGVLYLVDACQTVGQLPVDVEAIGCDMLSTTGRKYLRGPRGTGFLYVRRDVIDRLEPPFLDLHAATWVARDEFEIRPDARRFENWETNFAGKVGLGVAVDYALDWGIENTWDRIQVLSNTLRAQLDDIPGVTVQDIGRVKGGIVTFTVDGREPSEIKQFLADQKINVTTSSTASTRLDMEDRQLTGLVRASLHYYNTEEEIDRFLDVIEASR